MKSSAVTVETTATLLVAADDINRVVYLHNSGGQAVYIGNGDVTTSTGFHLGNGESQEIVLPSRQTLYGVVSANTNDVVVLQPDVD
jgi:hypothetical protein